MTNRLAVVWLMCILLAQTIILTSQFVHLLPFNRFRSRFRAQPVNEHFPLPHVRRDIFMKPRNIFDGTTMFPMMGLSTPQSMLQNAPLHHFASMKPYLNPTPLNGFVNPFPTRLAMLPNLNAFSEQQRLRIYHTRNKPRHLALQNSYLARNAALAQIAPAAHQLQIRKPAVLLQSMRNANRLTVANNQHLPTQLITRLKNEHKFLPTIPQRHPISTSARFPTQETVLQKPPLQMQHMNQNMRMPPHVGINIGQSSRHLQQNLAPALRSNFQAKHPVSSLPPPRLQNSVPKFPNTMIQYPQSLGSGEKYMQLQNVGRTQAWTQIPTTLITRAYRGHSVVNTATKSPALSWPKITNIPHSTAIQVNPLKTEAAPLPPYIYHKLIGSHIHRNVSSILNVQKFEDMPSSALIAEIEKAVEEGVEEAVSIPDTGYISKSKNAQTSRYFSPTILKENKKITSLTLKNQNLQSEEKPPQFSDPFNESEIKIFEPTFLKKTPHIYMTNQEESARPTNNKVLQTIQPDTNQTVSSSEDSRIEDLSPYFSKEDNQTQKLNIPEKMASILSNESEVIQKITNNLKNWVKDVLPELKTEEESPQLIRYDSKDPVYISPVNQNSASVNKKQPKENFPNATISTAQRSNLPLGTTRYSAYRKTNRNSADSEIAFGRRTVTITVPSQTSTTTTTIKPVFVYREPPDRNRQQQKSLPHAIPEITSKVSKNTFPDSEIRGLLEEESSIAPAHITNNEQNVMVTTHKNKIGNRLTTRSKQIVPIVKNQSEPLLSHTKLLSALNVASKIFGKRNATPEDSAQTEYAINQGVRELLMKQKLTYKPAESVQTTHSIVLFDKEIKDRLPSTNVRTLKPKGSAVEALSQRYSSTTKPSVTTPHATVYERHHPISSNRSSNRSDIVDLYKNVESARKDSRVPLLSTVSLNPDKRVDGENRKSNSSLEMVTFQPNELQTSESNIKYSMHVSKAPDTIKRIQSLKNKTIVDDNKLKHFKVNHPENQTAIKAKYVDQEMVMIDSLRSMKSRMQEVMSKGIRHMMPVIMTMGTDVELSSDCAFSLLRWIRGIKSMEQWAIKMVDASSKIPEGILYGTISTFGSYDECIAIGSESDSKVVMQGQYCSISMQPLLPQNDRHFTIKDAFKNYPKLKKIFQDFKIDETTMAYYYILKHHVGLCVPAKCSIEDIANVAEKMEEEFKMNVTVSHCETATKVKLSTGQIVSMTGVFVGIFTVALATIFDWMLNRKADNNAENNFSNQVVEQKMSAIRHFFSAFSAYSNSKRLLGTKLCPNSLPAIHGIKFLSISWIMLGHVYYCKDYLTIAGLSEVRDLGSNFAFQVILNSGFAADTFFVISGLLVVYTTLQLLQKKDGSFSIVSFYVKRYCRLTPAFLLTSALVFLGPLSGSGPLWKETLQPFVSGCENYWWTNLFYFSNFIPTAQTCIPHGWFVSCEFQFYIISPIIILALHKQRKLGIFLIAVGVILSAVAVGILTFVFDLAPTSLFSLPDPKDINEYLDTIGYKPYTHYAAYCVGMATGCFLVSNRKMKISKLTQLIGWCVSTAVCGCVIYGTWRWNSGDLPDWIVSVAYASTCRTAWSLGVAWVIIICASGHGGLINGMLSWGGFVPLSRLSYMAYLIHPLLMYVYASYVRSPFYFSQYVVVYLYFGHLCATFGLSFVLSMVFEVPFLNLEKKISKYMNPPLKVTSQNAAPQQSRRHWQHPDQPKVKDAVVLVRKLSERQNYL